MSAPRLTTRTVVRLSPLDESEDVAAFLQGLVTSDMKGALPVWAGLLSPQGKALFDFIVWPDPESSGGDLLLDCESTAAAALAKRLSLYRLRRRIAIAQDPAIGVYWQADGAPTDPRLPALGHRWIAPVSPDDTSADAAWLAHRLVHGVPEGLAELGSEQTLWLETNAAELSGVSFTKGCYVGQENTARMNWRQKVNRRLVVVPLDQSDPARQRVAYPELGLAVDHRRVEDIPASLAPAWMDLSPPA
ncbi:aminomethyltransferase [Novosphingobium fuchskuhlense]|uniref:Aminomethyltransferase n=1 Tax=Novosphingobium fuchskuhlense TaxID=1117702 RepID=A0A117UY05_9SPHN|nr:aminomethyltransferase [Novosphingobium fuchskuhlense]KUR72921.1 aminomethyltransferase [Novosphingobium fuchskuhlense]